MSVIEWVASALGVACVALGVVRSAWTFPAAIASVALLGWVVWRQHLYADAVLQLFFVGANLYGWAAWRRSRGADGRVVVERLSPGEAAGWLLAWAAGSAGWGLLLARATDAAYPLWDASTAVASMVAQVLMARRKVENWVIWIAADVALVPLYLLKSLPVVAALYLLYLALSVWGLIDWRRAFRAAAPVMP